MEPDIYQRFALQTLSDLAERRDQAGTKLVRGRRRQEIVSGKKQRVLLRGEHICYGGHERFRDSDATIRLVMAVMAYEKVYEEAHPTARRLRNGKVRGASSWACSMVAGIILRGTPLREHFLKGRRGRKAKGKEDMAQPVVPANAIRRPSILQHEVHISRLDELTAIIANEPRRRSEGGSKLPPEVRRLARILRSQVYEFRETRERECDQQFDASLGAFRSDFCRDAEWYTEAEPEYRRRLAALESQPELGCYDQQTAGATAVLADLLHQQQKFDEAIQVYWLSQERWKVASPVTEERRNVALALIAEGIADCQARRPAPRAGGGDQPSASS